MVGFFLVVVCFYLVDFGFGASEMAKSTASPDH